MTNVYPLDPIRAAVVPRAYSPESGEPLPISIIIENLLHSQTNSQTSSKTKYVCLQGRGKTTALQHVAAECIDLQKLVVLQGVPGSTSLEDYPDTKLFVFDCNKELDNYLELTIAPWNQDDVIEYLLAKHPKRCKSIMASLTARDENWLADGDPGIWSAVLDRFADDENVTCVSDAILEEIKSQAALLLKNRQIAELCIKHLDDVKKLLSELDSSGIIYSTKTMQFLYCDGVRVLAAAHQITNSIRQQSGLEIFFRHRWADRLYDLVASKIAHQSPEFQFLKKLAETPNDSHAAVAASLLVRIDGMWQPETQRQLRYDVASLRNVHWNKVHLNGANLIGADLAGSKLSNTAMAGVRAWEIDLSHCDLTDANLTRSRLSRANFSDVEAKRANLSNAMVKGARLIHADFSHSEFRKANLEQTNLTGTNFSKACLNYARLNQAIVANTNFYCANLLQADLSGLDFSTCNLDFANLTNTKLRNCTFEECSVTNATFDTSDCRNCTFTGSHFRDTSMILCNFSTARLAEVDWEGCNLQGANFARATFHLGSTRCGLVDSPFPSHGTRTGFYTDEYDEQYFRRPEEIRKANLRGCDLTGANVFDTDFYLVDLRDAICDDAQREHFQKCGAILTQ